MSNIFGKLRDLVSLNGPANDEYEYDEVDGQEYQNLYQTEHPQANRVRDKENHYQSEAEIGSAMNSNMNNNVVGMPGTSKWWGSVPEVVVMEPRVFEEMPQIVQALKDRKSVVLNLTMMDPDQAQRAVDFVAGATFTIDGHQERIGESIFLFTPSCVQVSTQPGNVSEAPQKQPMYASSPASNWVSEPAAASRLA